jgi:hypothetical protein
VADYLDGTGDEVTLGVPDANVRWRWEDGTLFIRNRDGTAPAIIWNFILTGPCFPKHLTSLNQSMPARFDRNPALLKAFKHKVWEKIFRHLARQEEDGRRQQVLEVKANAEKLFFEDECATARGEITSELYPSSTRTPDV